MRLSQKQVLFTQYVGLLIGYAADEGYHIAMRECYRTLEQQMLYVARGASRTENSRHLDGLAIDFVLYIRGEYQVDVAPYEPLGTYWEGLDSKNVWGGRWKTVPDGGHFEYTG